MLESYVAKFPAPRIENFRYVLRSGMLGWFSLMLDTNPWTAQQRAAAQREFALYKMAASADPWADVYHVADRPDGVHWDGMEYYSSGLRRGVLYAFRGSASDQPTHRFRLAGLKSQQTLSTHFPG